MIQEVLVALITAGPPTIMAYVSWRKLTTKTDEIHVLVNSNLTKVKSDLQHALAEIATLKKALKKR